MKIYCAIWEDRHSDTTVHLFSCADKAIEWAKIKCKEYDRFEDYRELNVPDWIFGAEYSCEGDCIYVVEVGLDEEV